jgi:tetratricopeptide (TPR) repeat protein
MSEFSDADYAKVKGLCGEGEAFAEAEQYPQALAKFWEALDLIPEPKTDWEAALWVLVAIGDTNFLSGDFEAGRDNLSKAMHIDGAIGNPFIHLRLGQCHFECGDLDKAADELTRAYAIDGEEIFYQESDKYFTFLKTRISLN